MGYDIPSDHHGSLPMIGDDLRTIPCRVCSGAFLVLVDNLCARCFKRERDLTQELHAINPKIEVAQGFVKIPGAMGVEDHIAIQKVLRIFRDSRPLDTLPPTTVTMYMSENQYRLATQSGANLITMSRTKLHPFDHAVEVTL